MNREEVYLDDYQKWLLCQYPSNKELWEAQDISKYKLFLREIAFVNIVMHGDIIKSYCVLGSIRSVNPRELLSNITVYYPREIYSYHTHVGTLAYPSLEDVESLLIIPESKIMLLVDCSIGIRSYGLKFMCIDYRRVYDMGEFVFQYNMLLDDVNEYIREITKVEKQAYKLYKIDNEEAEVDREDVAEHIEGFFYKLAREKYDMPVFVKKIKC